MAEDTIAEVNPKRWGPLELFKVIYPGDSDFDKLDVLYPGRIGYIFKRKDGSIERIVIARTWPHDVSDENETGVYSSDD